MNAFTLADAPLATPLTLAEVPEAEISRYAIDIQTQINALNN